jgi:hypothetical protein
MVGRTMAGGSHRTTRAALGPQPLALTETQQGALDPSTYKSSYCLRGHELAPLGPVCEVHCAVTAVIGTAGAT